MNKKIAFLTDCIRDDLTGVGSYAKSFINAFIEWKPRDYQVSFFDSIPTKFNRKNLVHITNPLNLQKEYLWQFLLPFRIQNQSPEYIFNFNPAPRPNKMKQKEILFVYDLSLKVHPETHPFARALHHKLFFKTMLNNCYKIVVMSDFTRYELLRYYPEVKNKITVFPYIISATSGQSKPSFMDNKPYLLNLNTIEPRKNIDLLIKAFSILKNKYNIPHKLIIAGKKGWKYKKIIELAKKYHLESDMIFSGYVDDKQKNYLYKHASVFVYPSKYEGYGIPIREALLAKCPVITTPNTDLTGIKSYVTIMKNMSAYTLANSIKYSIDHHEKAKEQAIKGYEQLIKQMELPLIQTQFEKLFRFLGRIH